MGINDRSISRKAALKRLGGLTLGLPFAQSAIGIFLLKIRNKLSDY
jgi:hypothetical protein